MTNQERLEKACEIIQIEKQQGIKYLEEIKEALQRQAFMQIFQGVTVQQIDEMIQPESSSDDRNKVPVRRAGRPKKAKTQSRKHKPAPKGTDQPNG